MVEINNQRKAFLDMLAWSEFQTIRRSDQLGGIGSKRRLFHLTTTTSELTHR